MNAVNCDPSEHRPIAALVLAAGSARRMGGPNKLLATFDGIPLVRRVVDAVIGSSASPVLVVTGARDDDVAAALAGIDVRLVNNRNYTSGLATSIAAGVRALAKSTTDIKGALIVLADMPGMSSEVIDRIIGAFDPAAGKTIIVPTANGKRGNPVLWGRAHFGALEHLTGDTGARHLIAENRDAVAFVEIGAAVAHDVDTTDAIRAAGGVLPD